MLGKPARGIYNESKEARRAVTQGGRLPHFAVKERRVMGFLKGLLGLGVTAGAAFAALKVAQKYEENKAADAAAAAAGAEPRTYPRAACWRILPARRAAC